MCMNAVVDLALQLGSNVPLMVVMYVQELTGHEALIAHVHCANFCFVATG